MQTYQTQKDSFCFSFLVFFIVLFNNFDQTCEENYPSDDTNPKFCSKPKSIIDFVGPICIPKKGGGFTQESIDNCGLLQNECPELNEHECIWQTWISDKVQKPCQFKELQFPACKLRYFAVPSGFTFSKNTWFEAMYVNQYGTTDNNYSIFSVVELHRLVKDKSNFPDSEQGDFPDGCIGPGSKCRQIEVLPKEKYNLTLPFQTLCANGIDEHEMCKRDVKDYLDKNFHTCFGDKRDTPPRQGKLSKPPDKVTWGYRAGCDVDIIGDFNQPPKTWKKMDVCRVIFEAHIEYIRRKTYTRDKVIDICEAQGYMENGTFKLRYTYDLRQGAVIKPPKNPK